MNRKEQITKVAQEILAAFCTGQLAEPLAQTFLNHGLHWERWTPLAQQPDGGASPGLSGCCHLQPVAGDGQTGQTR